MNDIYILLGGVVLRCALRYAESAAYFDNFLVSFCEDAPLVSVSELDWEFWKKNGAEPCAYLEYSSLTGSCSEALIPYGRCAFHSVALSHHGKAWLIAAGSGVGKTTQLRTLQQLYPGEFKVICGDRPILELLDDGGVFVHSSPWNGKEELGGACGAPLQGIICLSRGADNSVERITPREASIPVYLSVIQTGETSEAICSAAGFVTELLDRIPVWRMINQDIPDSTRLLYDTLFKEPISHDV